MPSTPSSDPLETFQLAEYDNIAEAHFTTVNTISTFFKSYLLIASVPITACAVLLQFWKSTSGAGPTPVDAVLKESGLLIPIGSTVVSVIGLFVLAYISNLRFDAILYARTVNGIRDYFWNKGGASALQELRSRVLPRSTHLPGYTEWWYFGWVVFTFALIDTVYLAGGWSWWWNFNHAWSKLSIGGLILLAAFFVWAHLYLYHKLARRKELRAIIGVDIDGVLNRHREHFCDYLKRVTGKTIDPEQLDKMPVHKCKDLGITKEDESKVFNTPDYWKKMPESRGVAEVLAQISNIGGYKVWIFTHRQWPDDLGLPDNERKVNAERWAGIETLSTRAPNTLPSKYIPIWRLTNDWLKEKNIAFDRLILETSQAAGTTTAEDRFSLSTSMDVFVEDDLEKALRLAPGCRLVFLIRQPYNRAPEGANADWKLKGDPLLPSNVIPVDSFEDIRKHLLGANCPDRALPAGNVQQST